MRCVTPYLPMSITVPTATSGTDPSPSTDSKKPFSPKRVQQRRAKGFKLPPNTKSVARPSRWGNPFRINPKLWEKIQKKPAKELNDEELHCCRDRAAAVRMFRTLMLARTDTRAEIKKELRGFNLACYCPLDQPCHADVLLEIANAP